MIIAIWLPEPKKLNIHYIHALTISPSFPLSSAVDERMGTILYEPGTS